MHARVWATALHLVRHPWCEQERSSSTAIRTVEGNLRRFLVLVSTRVGNSSLRPVFVHTGVDMSSFHLVFLRTSGGDSVYHHKRLVLLPL